MESNLLLASLVRAICPSSQGVVSGGLTIKV